MLVFGLKGHCHQTILQQHVLQCCVNVYKAFSGSVEMFEILLFLAAFSPVRMAEKDSNDIVLIEWIQPKYAFKLWALSSESSVM